MAHQVIPKVIPPKLQLVLAGRKNGNIAFHFKLPTEGLALHSVRIVDGVPEFTFAASRHVPTLREEDVATVFRLVVENKRPEFFYVNFPLHHPLLGRWYKQYSPRWLQWTGVGNLLADTDWNMKCLQVGARSNEEKTEFKSWSFTSQLTGLATKLDFPKEDTSDTSIIMSCDHARVQKSENEVLFPEEPKIIITDGNSKLYSKYISEIFPSVAYYDEPKFLKIQELIKLLLAVEWLCKEKGIRPNHKWMMDQTAKPTSASMAQSKMECDKKRKPPTDMIPKPSECKQPKTDVTVATWEAERNKSLDLKCGIKRLYGYCDPYYAEMFLFKEDGTPCPPRKSLKFNIRYNSPIGEMTIFQSVPISEQFQGVEEMKELKDKILKSLPDKLTYPLPASVETTVEDLTVNENGIKMEISQSLSPRPPLVLPIVRDTKVMTATVNDYDMLYAGMDPSMPIPGPYGAIIPNVKSWNELMTELTELPPCVLQFPYAEMMQPIATGGITTRNIPVREEPLPARVVNKTTQSNGIYSGSGSLLTVQGTDTRVQGKIQLVRPDSAEFDRVSVIFRKQWVSKTRKPPFISKIFAIKNEDLQMKWEDFKNTLLCRGHPQESQVYFHGSTLACDIATSQAMCNDNPECAICGISRNGMKLECMGKTNPENPRFGRGLYFAEYSSKSDDYAKVVRNTNGFKAILVCDILPGKCYKVYENGKNSGKRITDKPQGYDSVLGELGSTTSIPELVVYNPHAVLPRYIVIYKNI